MKTLLLVIAICFYKTTFSQTFWVNAKDNKSREALEEKCYKEKLKLTDSASADYHVNLVLEGHYKAVTIKGAFVGYLTITQNPSNTIISQTKEYRTNPAATNGYNASYAITKKLINKQFVKLIIEMQKKNLLK